MDVLLINYTGRKGAGPLVSYEIAKAFIDKGLPVVAVLSDQIENLSLWKKLKLEKIVLIPTYHNALELIVKSCLFNFAVKKKVKDELKDYNVKYIFCPMGAFWTDKINRIFPRAKKGIVIHDPKAHSGEGIFNFLKPDYKSYDYLFVHSKKFVNEVREEYNRPTHYILLGRHDIYKYCENKRSIISYSKDKVNFIFFGRISKYKGLDILADAYREVENQLGDKVSLSVIGSGDFAPYSDKFNGLHNVTIINRWIADEETEDVFIGDNLICICPYIDATQSGVILLAYGYEVPVIATRTGGMEDQVIDGKTGLLVNPSNVEDLKNAMLKLASDHELYSNMVECVKEYNVQMDWSKTAKMVMEDMNISL